MTDIERHTKEIMGNTVQMNGAATHPDRWYVPLDCVEVLARRIEELEHEAEEDAKAMADAIEKIAATREIIRQAREKARS